MKQHSRQVAMKAKECMDRLRSLSSCDTAVSHIYQSIALSEGRSTGVGNNSSPCELNSTIGTVAIDNKIENIRQKKVAFSTIEDNFLFAGIRKYGSGKWTAILNDPNFAFHPSRKTATLCTRAKLKGWS